MNWLKGLEIVCKLISSKNALMGLRDQADVTGLEFKQLTADIAVDARMRQAGTGAIGFKGKLKGLVKGAGAIAAGGIFGGAEGVLVLVLV